MNFYIDLTLIDRYIYICIYNPSDPSPAYIDVRFNDIGLKFLTHNKYEFSCVPTKI